MSGIDDRLREELGALLDGALPAERADALRRRIETDAELRREFEELKRTVAAVHGLPRERAPADLRARLRGELAEPRGGGRLVVLRRWAAVAAAALVVVAGAVLALRPGPARQEAEEAKGRSAVVADREDDEAAGEPAPEPAAAPRKESRKAREKSAARLEEARDGESDALEAAEEVVRRLDEAKVGKRARQQPGTAKGVDVVLAFEQAGKLAANDQAAYLAQLNRLPRPKVQEHIFALVPENGSRFGSYFQPMAEARAGRVQETPQLDLSVVSREAALQMHGLLTTKLPSATVVPAEPAPADAKQQAYFFLTIEDTPGNLGRYVAWLEKARFLAQRPAAAEAKVAKPRGGPEKDNAGADAGGGAGAKAAGAEVKEKRQVRIRIQYPEERPRPGRK